jgi:hypothetical protein
MVEAVKQQCQLHIFDGDHPIWITNTSMVHIFGELVDHLQLSLFQFYILNSLLS